MGTWMVWLLAQVLDCLAERPDSSTVALATNSGGRCGRPEGDRFRPQGWGWQLLPGAVEPSVTKSRPRRTPP